MTRGEHNATTRRLISLVANQQIKKTILTIAGTVARPEQKTRTCWHCNNSKSDDEFKAALLSALV